MRMIVRGEERLDSAVVTPPPPATSGDAHLGFEPRRRYVPGVKVRKLLLHQHIEVLNGRHLPYFWLLG